MNNATIEFNTMKAAANNARRRLDLKFRPVVIRNAEQAFSIVDACKSVQIVMKVDAAYWIVCADDARVLEAAGYEHASR